MPHWPRDAIICRAPRRDLPDSAIHYDFRAEPAIIKASLHFVPDRFVPGHFVPVISSPNHFVPRLFRPWSICPLVISSPGHLVSGHLIPGHFVPSLGRNI
jgi:hypothetical protein